MLNCQTSQGRAAVQNAYGLIKHLKNFINPQENWYCTIALFKKKQWQYKRQNGQKGTDHIVSVDCVSDCEETLPECLLTPSKHRAWATECTVAPLSKPTGIAITFGKKKDGTIKRESWLNRGTQGSPADDQKRRLRETLAICHCHLCVFSPRTTLLEQDTSSSSLFRECEQSSSCCWEERSGSWPLQSQRGVSVTLTTYDNNRLLYINK